MPFILTIKVGQTETDYTQYVDWKTVAITEKINIPSQLTFSMLPSSSQFKVPPQRAYVKIYSLDQDRSIFTGYISSEPTRNYQAVIGWGVQDARDPQLGRIPRQLFRYDITCTSDEHLLNIKAVPFIPAYINRTQGQILADIANVLSPSGFFDTSQVASGDIVPFYQYDPTQSWCEIAKKFADGSRYRYKVRDKQIFYVPYGDEPLGITYDERHAEVDFDPKGLQTTVLAVPMVNDVTIIGDAEAGNNREDYVIGDGFTGNFPLHHRVFRGNSVVLLQESWNNQEINTQQWFLGIPEDPVFDLTAGALNVVAGGGAHAHFGESYLSVQNGIEIAGATNFEVGEVTFNDFCEGLLGGLYTDSSFSAASLLGGFYLQTTGAITQPTPILVGGIDVGGVGVGGIHIRPFWTLLGTDVSPSEEFVIAGGVVNGRAGFGIGPGVVTQPNHSYVLQLIVTAPKYTRYDRIYRTIEGEEFGGGVAAVSGNITFAIQDYDILQATGFYYTPKVTYATIKNVQLPSFALYALVNNLRLNLTITNSLIAQMPLGSLMACLGPSGLAQPSGLILPMLPPDSGGFVGTVKPWPSFSSGSILLPPGLLDPVETQLVMGNGYQLQAAQITPGNDVDTLAFYAQTQPAAGTRIRYQSWENQAAVSRLQDELSINNEKFVVGDDGIRSAIVTDLNPLPRTSEDCDHAGLAFLKDRVGVFYNGTYTITSLSFKGLTADAQFYPTVGRFLNVHAPRRGIVEQKFLCVGLTITFLDAQTELLQYQIQFGADLYLEKVLKNFVDLAPVSVLTPVDKANPPNPRFTQDVDNSYLPDLNHTQANSLAISDTAVTVNIFDDYFGPIEVRRINSNWGAGQTRDLIGTFVGPTISLPRQQFDQIWYMRPVAPISGFTLAEGQVGSDGQIAGLGPSGNITSRRSKVIRVRYPLKPLSPIYVNQNGGLLQFDFKGDRRNIYGFEIRAVSGAWLSPASPASGFIEHVLVQKPLASYADMTIDLAATPFNNGFDFSTRVIGPGPGGWFFLAYFFNQCWSYSTPTAFGIGPTGIGPRVEWGIVNPFVAGTVTLNTEVRSGFNFSKLKWNVSLDFGQMPVGQDAIFDVQFSTDQGVTWNSIFPAGPVGNPNKNMLHVVAGGPNFGEISTFAIRGFNVGDWVKVVCIQAGSTTAGSGLQGILY